MQAEMKSTKYESEGKVVQCDWIVLGERSYLIGWEIFPKRNFFGEARSLPIC
jgi:hypothetical protein